MREIGVWWSSRGGRGIKYFIAINFWLRVSLLKHCLVWLPSHFWWHRLNKLLFLVVVIPLQQGSLLHFSTWPLALEILESLAWEFRRRLDSALSFPAFWPEPKLPPLSSTSSLCGWLINMERICITKLGIWQPFSASHWFKDVFYLECHQRNPDLFCGAFKTHLEAAK